MAETAISARAASPASFEEAELLRSVSANSPKQGASNEATPEDSGSNPAAATTSGNPNTVKATTTGAPHQQLVDHTYTDYAIVDEDDLHLLDENSSLLPKPASVDEANAREKLKGMDCTYGPMKKNAGGVIQPFPGKLLEVLDRVDLTDIVDWMPHGRAFIVKKPKLFATEVLPRFFKQTKFLSFTRQLNLWGFKRITKGVDGGAYYHELFLRGRSYLAMRMRRQKIKGTGMKLTPNPEGEPDFYNKYPPMPGLNSRRILPPLPPLPAERVQNENADAGGTNGAVNGAFSNIMAGGFGGMGAGGLSSATMMGTTLDRLSNGGFSHFDAATGRDASSLFGQGSDVSNLAAAAENRLRQSYAASGYGRQAHAALSGAAGAYGNPQGHAGANPAASRWSGAGVTDDLLLAPGVGPFESTRLRYLEGASGMGGPHHHHAAAAAAARGPNPAAQAPGAGGGLNPNPTNDPIHDELSAMIRSRSQSSAAANAAMYNAHPAAAAAQHASQLGSDRLLMERLRDLDRTTQLKREQQQDMSMLRRARLFDDSSVGGVGGGVGGVGHFAAANRYFSDYGHAPNHPHTPHSQHQHLSGNSVNSLVQQHSQGVGPGAGSSQDPFSVLDPTSVSDALREANQLEEMAMAKRAKARSLALAGALQQRFGMVGGAGAGEQPQQQAQQQQAQPNSHLHGQFQHTQFQAEKMGAPRGSTSSPAQPPQQPGARAGAHTAASTATSVGAPGAGNEGGAAEGRPSFGRPFGRRD